MNRFPNPLRRTLRSWLAPFRLLGPAQTGVAAVEFALIMPFLLLLYLGAMELSSLIVVDRRVTTVSGTLGDLVSRTNKTLPVSVLNDYFKAAEAIMMPYSATGLGQVVTLVAIDSAGKAQVKWSRPYGSGTAYATNAVYPLDANAKINELAREGYIVIAESNYAYLPLLGLFFKVSVPLSSKSYYLPRFDDIINLNLNQ